MKKKYAIGILLVIVLIIGGIVLRGHKSLTAGGTSNIGDLVADSLTSTTAAGGAGTLSVTGATTLSGSLTVAGNATFSGSETRNGLTSTSTKISMTSGTTTPCSIASPSSTSTIGRLYGLVTTGTSTPMTMTFATATTPYATTSLIVSKAIAANAQGLLTWSPGADTGQVAPNTYINLGVQGGGIQSTGFTIAGTCAATFNIVN